MAVLHTFKKYKKIQKNSCNSIEKLQEFFRIFFLYFFKTLCKTAYKNYSNRFFFFLCEFSDGYSMKSP